MLRFVFLVLTMGSAQVLQNPRLAPPFWRKDRLYERIQAREILVHVSSHEAFAGETLPNLLQAVGGGETSLDCATVFAATQYLDELARSSEYVKRSHFDPKTHTLELDLEAFSHKSSLRVELIAQAETTPQAWIYRVLTGPMAGYSGEIQFFPVAAKCDVGFTGEYKYARFPIPHLFLEFGMEVVLQRLAFRARSYLEEKTEKTGIKKEAHGASSS